VTAVGIGIGVEEGKAAADIMGDASGVGPASPKLNLASLTLMLVSGDLRLVVDFEAVVGSDFWSAWAAFCVELTIGRDRPLSFPLLATPTPHVRVVL
jgi:hypothetical protein